MKKIIKAVRSKEVKTKHLIVLFLGLGALCLWIDLSGRSNPSSKKDARSVDTYIPSGMTLVPIEIQNIESLRNILGDYGVVDLYMPSMNPRNPPRKIASNVKIMRAPLNPDVFAVLVKTEDAPAIASQTNAFFVTIQNPKNQKTQFRKSIRHTHIITEM